MRLGILSFARGRAGVSVSFERAAFGTSGEGQGCPPRCSGLRAAPSLPSDEHTSIMITEGVCVSEFRVLRGGVQECQ